MPRRCPTCVDAGCATPDAAQRVVCAEGEFETGSYIQVNRAFVLTVLADRRIAPGSAGLSAHHRKWMNVAVNDQLEVIPFDPWLGIGQDHLLGAMTVEVRPSHATCV